MKQKLIASSSIALSLVFAFALANADDNTSMSNPSSNTSATTSDLGTSSNSAGNSAGTVGSTTDTTSNTPSNTNTMSQPGTPGMMDSDSMNSGAVSSDTTMTKSKETSSMASNMGSCTDKDGISYRKGQAGFKTCMKAHHMMKKDRGGSVKTETTHSTQSTDQPGKMDSSDSSMGNSTMDHGSSTSDTSGQ